ncbi:MAG: VOC family protein [Actinomycetota bacterium]|nr:VOC family protein [Acidimicrobiia bacterium]MDQ3468171.1 VOC family protein [Actinomycetota bacterium]
MWLRLRQIALVARDLDAVVDDIRAVLGLEVGFRDPQIHRLGLHNAVMPVGGEFLEVVSPTAAGTTAERYLDRRRGNGGYMVITQCDDHPPRRARVEALGIRIVAQFDDDGFTDVQLHPADTGGSFLEIDHQDGGDSPSGRWSPAGPDWHDAVRTDVVSAITAAEIQCDDPAFVAARWSEVVELPVEDRDGVRTIALENAAVRFVEITDGRGEGLGGVDLRVVGAERLRAAADQRGLPGGDDHVIIGGLRMYLR